MSEDGKERAEWDHATPNTHQNATCRRLTDKPPFADVHTSSESSIRRSIIMLVNISYSLSTFNDGGSKFAKINNK